MNTPPSQERSDSESIQSMRDAQFFVGEVVRHQMFDYHGVIYDVDPYFMGSDEWYDAITKTHPPKNQPWYHVLVDSKGIETYVAERNLMACAEQVIEHPLLNHYFTQRGDAGYVLKRLPV